MKILLKIWLVLFIGVLVGISIQQSSGYVLLAFGHYSIEMTLVFFLILNSLLFIFLYYLIRLWIRTWQTPKNIYSWYQKYRIRRSQKKLTYGLLDLAEGRWKKAEKKLLNSVSDNQISLINYLGAAKAAQQQGNNDRRDSYIRLAHAQMPSANIAVGLTQAELQLADHQLEQALATLQYLNELTPKHSYILRLLYQLYERLSDWEQLIKLLPELKKNKVFNPGKLEKIELKIRRELLKRITYTKSVDELISLWNSQPSCFQKNPVFLSDYISYLKHHGSDDRAENLLYSKICEKWQPDLLELYGKLDIKESGKHLKRLEKYLAKYPDNVALLFVLGRLSLQENFWGKARDYLEKCINQSDPPVMAYRELGRLLEHIGELKHATVYYRKALLIDNEDTLFSSLKVKSISVSEKLEHEPAPHGAIKSNCNV